MTHRWPVWRTDPAAANHATLRHYVIAGLVAFILPLLFGLAGLLLQHILRHFGSALPDPVLTVVVIATFGATVSWLGLLIGGILAKLAASKGFAGWATALCFGALLPPLIAALVLMQPGALGVMFLVFGLSGAAHAIIFWMTLRFCVPEAFFPRKSSTAIPPG